MNEKAEKQEKQEFDETCDRKEACVSDGNKEETVGQATEKDTGTDVLLRQNGYVFYIVRDHAHQETHIYLSREGEENRRIFVTLSDGVFTEVSHGMSSEHFLKTICADMSENCKKELEKILCREQKGKDQNED